jgi:hypothetical protein
MKVFIYQRIHPTRYIVITQCDNKNATTETKGNRKRYGRARRE